MPSAVVIDGSRQMANSMCQMLMLLGVDAKPAYGPRAAMLLFNEAAPDIIFLDINMPGVDEFEVMAYLRRQPGLGDVPVVVVISDDQPETIDRAHQMGGLPGDRQACCARSHVKRVGGSGSN